MNTSNFTMVQALAIQEKHLQQWETILKPEVSKRLRELVLATNKDVKNPFRVCRGCDIDIYVHNPALYFSI